MKRGVLLFAVILFSVLFSISALAADCPRIPECPSFVRDCGCGGNQSRYTLCEGGCSEWYACSVSDVESVCDDGLDNDCDTKIDCADSNCNTNPFCIDGDGDSYTALSDCSDDDPSVHPGAPELCNLKDDNCDGTVDEGCTCTPAGSTKPCGIPTGICSVGSQICLPGGSWGACSGTPPATEICDGLDNDCDGTRDEGCACIDDQTRSCGSDIGSCTFGTERCISGAWGPCLGGITPVSEICGNAKDDNCDGAVDEGCPSAEPAAPIPVVAGTPSPDTAETPSTVPASGSGSMRPIASRECIDEDGDTYGQFCGTRSFDCDDQDASIHPGAPEVCNNKDDDCNNIIDEHVIRDCGVSNIGICTIGSEQCFSGSWISCDAVFPEEERCNNQLDDDCDGSVDEDCRMTKELTEDGLALKQFLDLKYGEDKYDLDHYLERMDETAQFTNIKKYSTVRDGKTMITIEVLPVQGLYDITIFEYIPKSITQSAKDIIFTTEPDIIQDDPLVAWHFAELTEKTDLSYEVRGEHVDAHEKTSTVPVAEEIRPIVRPWYFNMLPLLFLPLLGLIFIVLVQIAHKRRR